MAKLTNAERPFDNRAYHGDIGSTKKELQEQDKFRIWIPQPPGSKKHETTHLPVTINGFRMNIPYGHFCEVPESVYLVLVGSPTPADPEMGFVPPQREQDVELMPTNIESGMRFEEWVEPMVGSYAR